MKQIVFALVVVLSAVSASAQTSPVPVTYRVTRTAAGQPAQATEFPKAAMTCALPVAAPAAGAIRITDPLRADADCERADPAFFANMVRELAYTYTIAGKVNDLDGYGPESSAIVITLPRIPQIPGAPGNLRGTPPGVVGVASLGIVNATPYRFGGLEVAPVTLDGGVGEVFLGATRLQSGNYSVKRGDRVSLMLWRDR